MQQFIVNLSDCVQESGFFDCELRAVKEIVKWIVDSTSKLQEQREFIESWKLCLHLCSPKWLNPRRSLVTNFSSFGLLQLKTLFAFGLMKLKIFFFKISEALDFSKSRVQFIPFNNRRWETRIFEKNCVWC